MIEAVNREETTMEEGDIERIAARVVEKLLEPAACGMLASAIAKSLRQMAMQYEGEMSRLGERLEMQRF
jgi:hypothetical protein